MRLQWEEEGTRGEPRYDRSLRRTGCRADTTEYLLGSPANARVLLGVVGDIEAGRNLMRFGSVDELRAAAGLGAPE